MKKCKECGADVSGKAESCPHCGARLKSKPIGCGGTIAVIVLAVIIFAAIGSALDGDGSAPSEPAIDHQPTSHPVTFKDTTASTSSASRASSEATANDWNYNTSTDPLSGKKKETAFVASTNSLHLSFPYGGANYGHLIVRHHPQYGLDVIVSVDKGQILCGLYTCKLKIRFDNGSVQDFTMAPAADQSTTVVFARHPKWAIDHLRNAHKIIVQVPMYQEGNQVLEFDVQSPLTWPPK